MHEEVRELTTAVGNAYQLESEVTRFVNEDKGSWITARRCTSGTCVEVRATRQGSDIRNNRQNFLGPMQPIIALTADEWRHFATKALSGRSEEADLTKIQHHSDGAVTLSHGDTTLDFDADEWSTFVGGLAEGDFD